MLHMRLVGPGSFSRFGKGLLITLVTAAAMWLVFSGSGDPSTYGAGRSFQTSPAQTNREGRSGPLGGDIRPVRIVRDPYPSFENIAVDPINDEVVMTDGNWHSLLVYSRTINVAGRAEPRRRISGPRTKLEYACAVAIDPVRREIYTANADQGDNMLVFSHQQHGDAEPLREVTVPHAARGISLDLDNDEVAVVAPRQVAIFRRGAEGDGLPLRVIQGPKTELADAHGVFIDAKNDEIVVVNQQFSTATTGQEERSERTAGAFPPLRLSTRRFVPPSITVYPRTANGDVAPLRKIQGPRTRLDLPHGVYVDTERDELVVADNGGNSILVFSRTATGDVAPLRVIEGPDTGLKNPTGIYVDVRHDEIWVSNWADHSATVYPRTAQGNVPPLRAIRSAPPGAPSLGLGNPSAIAYDPVRERILVPN